VEFSGNSVLDEAALRARLTFAESGAVDPVEVRASVRQLEAAYREQGYHFIQISGSLDQEGEALVVRFQVEEGPQVTVEAVTFSGNEIVPARRLRQQVETRPRAFLRPGLFRQEILDRDLRVLLAFLRSEGFAEAAVGQAEVRFSEDRSRARLTIPIVEGPRLAVGAVAVEGQTVLTADEVLAALPLRPGEPWDPARAEEGRGIVLRLYARRGYHAARVAVETRPRDGAVDVTYRIVEEGSQTRIGRILIGGLILTRERVVLRELGFGPGDPFDPERLTEAQARLTALRLFEQVEVEPLRPPPTPFADVRITVREGRPWRLDIGLGYSTDEEGRAFLELGHDNLFGTGRSAALRQKVSGRGERSDLTYREPHLFGTLWQAEAGLVREHREEIGFEIERLGGSVGIHRELFAERITGLRAAVGYRFERVVRFRVSPELAVADVVPGSQLIARVTPALTLERRDDPLDPKRGSLHLLSVEGGGGPVGGEVDFVKGRLETHWFLDWLPPTVLALSARVGLATPFGDTPALAIEDRFFAGGSTTVRGFRKDRLGPRDAAGNPTGGDAQVILNAEWRFPIWGWLGGAVFVDSGAVTREVGDLGPGEFETAVGAGVRLRTPVGPIRADFGYLLAPFPGEDRWQLHVTVGHPF
jgi:outer membrane protein insertion porin family